MARKHVKKEDKLSFYVIKEKMEGICNGYELYQTKDKFELKQSAWRRGKNGNFFVDFPAGTVVNEGYIVTEEVDPMYRMLQFVVVGVEEKEDKVCAQLLETPWFTTVYPPHYITRRAPNPLQFLRMVCLYPAVVLSLPNVTFVNGVCEASGFVEFLLQEKKVYAGDFILLHQRIYSADSNMVTDVVKSRRNPKLFYEHWVLAVKEIVDSPYEGFVTAKATPLSYKIAGNDEAHDVCSKIANEAD